MKVRKPTVLIGLMLVCQVCAGEGLVGKKAPEITIRQWITNNPPVIKNLSGSVFILEFWATWCPPCVEGVPAMVALNNKYEHKGLKLIALSQDKSAEKIRQFVKEKRINYHVAIDNGTADWFGVKGYPTVAVVNHKGIVLWQGYPWDSEFEKKVAAAIKAAPPPLLTGVDLGPFRHLKEPLRGGAHFAGAYRQIESCTRDNKSSESAVVAKKIVDTIDKRISEEISRAEQIQKTNIFSAYNIYEDLVERYDGIEVVEPAKMAYLKLKKRKVYRNASS